VSFVVQLFAGGLVANRYASNNPNITAANPSFNPAGNAVGDTNPSITPATTSIGMVPTSSRTASAPASASASRRASTPGNSSPCAMRSPAPPAMKMAGSSSTPCGATKLHSCRLMPLIQHAAPITPSSSPLNTIM